MKEVSYTLSKIVTLFAVLATMFSGCKPKEPLNAYFEYIEFATLDSTAYAIRGGSGIVEDVHIPVEYDGHAVAYIYYEGFRGYRMKSLTMESITVIYDKAFYFCPHLESLDLGTVERIGPLAFGACRSLTSVMIPASCREIDAGAFSGCENLKTVYFEGAPEKIDPTAFDEGITIYGPQNSTVEEYAHENGFRFLAWPGVSPKDN